MSTEDRDVQDSEGLELDVDPEEAPGYVGQSQKRREDAPLLRGEATYTDDFGGPETTALAFVRSDVAHGTVEKIETADAEAIDGVLAVYTWDDLADGDAPMVLPASTEPLDCEVPGHPVLAREKVRYDGQPVAAVVAEDRYIAADGVEAVDVTYDELPAVTEPDEAASDDAPTLYENVPDNVAVTAGMGDEAGTEAVFEEADEVVSVELENNRLVPSALEPRAAMARYDHEDGLTVTLSSQSPHGHRRKLSHTLGLPEREIRVISPEVGGGFGHKGHHHPGEAMAAWAARDLGREVKWTATRSANYREGAHGRDHRTEAELALTEDGEFLGIRVETYAGVGGYALGGGAAMPGWYGRLLSSQYTVDEIYCESNAVFTTTAPVHSYRGAGRPEAIYVTERLVDVAAAELGRDPIELRRQNLIGGSANRTGAEDGGSANRTGAENGGSANRTGTEDEIDADDPAEVFPYETPVGATYDSGDYEPVLDAAADAVADEPRGGERDENGRLRGVGVAAYVESTGGGFESGVVRVHPDGSVTVTAGTHDHGQGHETTYAAIVADELPVEMGDIRVVEGDTAKIPTGTGTFGSRSTIVGGNAVAESAQAVREKARRVAAAELDADPEDVVAVDGGFEAGEGERVSFADVANAAYGRGLPEELEPGLEATTFYELENTAYTFGAHAVAVAVDPETGELTFERYVAVDDCGIQVNPQLVEGQVHGGVAQGIGQARSEQAAYDEDGQLASSTMLDYGLPRAGDLPDIETMATETPSPTNALGVKGIGEAGTVAAPPAVVSAVADALPGVVHLDMPLTDETVAEALSA